ncbi:MAG: hypothetical protein PHP46_06450, partial [Candidatus Omnitrophica bacterium]|nr:hypothetical protein [Candidatus Omnitrophota bacterium]
GSDENKAKEVIARSPKIKELDAEIKKAQEEIDMLRVMLLSKKGHFGEGGGWVPKETPEEIKKTELIREVVSARELFESFIGELKELKKRTTSILQGGKFDIEPGAIRDIASWFGIISLINLFIKLKDRITGRHNPKTIQEKAAKDILGTLDKIKERLDGSADIGKDLANLGIPMLEKTGARDERFLGNPIDRSVDAVLEEALQEALKLIDINNGIIRVAPPLFNNQIEIDGKELLFQKLERVLWGEVQLLRDVHADIALGENADLKSAVQKEIENRKAKFELMADTYEKIAKPINYSSFTVLSTWQKIVFLWIPILFVYTLLFLHFSGVDITFIFYYLTAAYCIVSLSIMIHKIIVVFFGLLARDTSSDGYAERLGLTPIVDVSQDQLKLLSSNCIGNMTKEELLAEIPEEIRARLGEVSDLSKAKVLDKVLEVLTPQEVLKRLSLKARTRLEEAGINLNSKEAVISSLSDEEFAKLRAYDALPLVSVFLPVYKEKNVISLLLRNIKRLGYPKVEIIVVGEEDDNVTMPILYEWKERGELPSCVKIAAGHVPGPNLPGEPHQPRTKPRAIQYALNEAKGKFMVIYDAEDRPEEDQLDKFVYGYTLIDLTIKDLMRKVTQGGKVDIEKISRTRLKEEDSELYERALRFGFDLNLAGMVERLGIGRDQLDKQGSFEKLKKEFVKVNKPAALSGFLDWFNWYKSRTARCFSAEYQMHFKTYIPGLSAMRSAVLLPGTTYFMPLDIYKELGGLDIYNVTEDEHLGVLLWIRGHRTVVLNTSTNEEAIDNLLRYKWIMQRSRWFKGDWHSFLVYLRHSGELIKNRGIRGFIDFVAVIGGGALSSYLYLVASIVTLMWGLRFLPILPVIGPYLTGIPFLGHTLQNISYTMATQIPAAFSWIPFSPALGGFLLYIFPLVAVTLISQIAVILEGPNDEFKLKVTIDEIRTTAGVFEEKAKPAESEELKAAYLEEASRLKYEADRTEKGELTPSEKATLVTELVLVSLILPLLGFVYYILLLYLYHQHKNKGVGK